MSLNGPFVKYLLKQEDNCCKNLTRLGQNLWATFHSALRLYNSHKNWARRQSLVILVWGSPGRASSSALLSVNQTCQWRARAQTWKMCLATWELRPGSKFSLYFSPACFCLHHGSSRTNIFAPSHWFSLDCLNTVKILLVALSGPAQTRDDYFQSHWTWVDWTGSHNWGWLVAGCGNFIWILMENYWS